MVDTAERIDAPARRVLLASGGEIGYDYLIDAVGSTGSVPEFAYGLSEFEDAQRLRDRLDELGAGAPVVVVGAGLTGIETAAELAEQGHPVSLVGALGPSLAPSGRRSVAKRLRALGVDVVRDVEVRAVAGDNVTLSDGRVLPSAVTIWTAGFGVPGLAAASGLSVDDIGRLRTDETLTSIDDPRIVAAGDCASPSDLPLRMSCQAAMPMGAQAAQTVLARIAGTEPAVLNQAFASQCLSVGRTAGTVQFSHSDDTPRTLFLGGRIGAFVKEKICRYTVVALRREAAEPGAYTWFKSGWRRDRVPVPVAAR